MHIAIMGGTFNPIHFGHLRIAEEVREAFGINKVLFIPAFQPPHKDNGSLISPEHRLEIVRLAVKDNPFFEASDIEIKRGGRSYSVVTLRAIYEMNPDTGISFIVGTDSFNDITTWCEYEGLFKLTNFIVIPRPGYPVKKVAEVLPVELARKFWYDAEKGIYSNSYGRFVAYMETTLFGISASRIREMIKQGSSTRYLLPGEVEEYIERNKLYRQVTRRLTKLNSKQKALKAARLALNKKAEDVILLNISKLSSIADYLMICSAASDKQVQAIAGYVEEEFKKKHIRPLSTEGIREGRWVVMDYGDVIAHIFLEPVREFYNLEGLWPDVPRSEVK